VPSLENENALGLRRDNPTLTDFGKLLKRAALLGARVSIPGKVVTYDPATQTATIEAQLKPVRRTTDGEAQTLPLIMPNMPVAWPRTATGYLTFPLAVGDTGQLIVVDRAIQEWRRLGVATDPVMRHTHNLSDAVFYPGLHPDTTPITPPTSLTATVLDGSTTINIGALAAESIAKAESLLAALDAAFTAAVSAAAPIASPTADGGTAGFTALQAAWNATKTNVAALKGKVE
jgi:hypothetical protein